MASALVTHLEAVDLQKRKDETAAKACKSADKNLLGVTREQGSRFPKKSL